MANPRQRRKARSASTLKPSLNAKRQMKKKLVRAPTVHGADVLKDNYDPKLTLRQNYAKLGLVPSLDVRPDTGGTEKFPSTSSSAAAAASGSKGSVDERTTTVRKGMARIIRDKDGNVVDIIEAAASDDESSPSSSAASSTPWVKPLKSSIADVDSSEIHTYMPPQTTAQASKVNPVLAELEERAAKATPVKRHTSQQESQWLSNLISKYDQDTEAMAKDRELNVWQKTSGEIKRAIRKAGGFAAFQ